MPNPPRSHADPLRSQRQPPTRRLLVRLIKGLAIGASGVVAALVLLILVLRWVPVPTSAFMLSHQWHGSQPEYRWVEWQFISPAMPVAVVAAEDSRFLQHWGFDFEAIAAAFRENRWRARPRGASTISQQVAKNLFLWPNPSWLRKGLEAGLTVIIEACWPKQRILEVYLNIAQFGPRTFGVDAASRRYFNIPPSQLDHQQAALMAAVLPKPAQYSLSSPSTFLHERAAQIQARVRLMGGETFLSPLDRRSQHGGR